MFQTFQTYLPHLNIYRLKAALDLKVTKLGKREILSGHSGACGNLSHKSLCNVRPFVGCQCRCVHIRFLTLL